MRPYHHGSVIKEFREKNKITQAKLAEKWPRSDGGIGVSISYVVEVEAGRKKIEDQEVLRKLSHLLDIPLYRFGLSEYNPFTSDSSDVIYLPGQGKAMHNETLDIIEDLIHRIWGLRCAARLSDAENSTKRLNRFFHYFNNHLPPPTRLEKRYLMLYIQSLRLTAVLELEKKQYQNALRIYRQIYELVKNLEEPSLTALALKSMGKELDRRGEKHEAMLLLEEARDVSLNGSKLLMAFVHSYLIRVYGSNRESLRFERAVNTGLTIANSLRNQYVDGTDFVYSWSPISAILAEKSWGYLELGEPQKTLDMRDEIIQAIKEGKDERLYAWIPLDWAKAYTELGEIEEAIKETREFYQRASLMKSPHAISQVGKVLKRIEAKGYKDVNAVKDFQEEIIENKKPKKHL